MSSTARLLFQLDVEQVVTDALGTVGFSPQLKKQIAYTAGITEGLIDRAYVKEHTIVGGATLSLDLSGALTDVLGQSAVFAKVRGLFLLADDTNTANLQVGGNANAFVGPLVADAILALEPSELIALTSRKLGWAVTAGTGDILDIENMDGAVAQKVKVAILGTSA